MDECMNEGKGRKRKEGRKEEMNEGMNGFSDVLGLIAGHNSFFPSSFFLTFLVLLRMALKPAQKNGGEPHKIQWHDDIHLTSQTLKPSTVRIAPTIKQAYPQPPKQRPRPNLEARRTVCPIDQTIWKDIVNFGKYLMRCFKTKK